LEEFSNYYLRSKKTLFSKEWKTFKKDNSKEPNFLQWLPNFYEDFIQKMNEEHLWISQIITDNSRLTLLTSLLQQTLSTLDPSFYIRLKAVFDFDEELVSFFIYIFFPQKC